jgi:glycosyltransferase involved in cell wall biosynthesis
MFRQFGQEFSMNTPLKILHFSLASSFDRKFLFHPNLNNATDGVHYFAIGRSGYLYDQAKLTYLLGEYLRALRLLYRGFPSTNKNTIAYCHTTKFALPGLLLCRLFGIGQVIYFNHGVPYIGHQGLKCWILQLLERINVAVAHRFITVSPAMVPFLKAGHVTTHYNYSTHPGSSSGLRDLDYLDFERFRRRVYGSKAHNGTRYLYAGRLQARKGIFVLLDAWRSHVFKYPEDELWLCGFSIEELAAKAPGIMIPGIIVRGYLNDMKSVYDDVDVVISPSFHEGFGYTLLEGAARGCCIVSSSIPGPNTMFTPWMSDLIFKVGCAKNLEEVMSRLSSSNRSLARSRLLSFRSALRFRASKLTYPPHTF